jgi:hypothetical protein
VKVVPYISGPGLPKLTSALKEAEIKLAIPGTLISVTEKQFQMKADDPKMGGTFAPSEVRSIIVSKE